MTFVELAQMREEAAERKRANEPTGIIERLLCLLFPFQDITHAGSLYLRWWLLTPSLFGWRLMLHRIARPDADRVLHDHPWDFATLCLRGGYEELVLGPGGVHRQSLRAFEARMRASGHTHRIETIVGQNAWTLVLHGPRHRSWGFWDTARSPATFTVADRYFTADYDKAAPAARRWIRP